jgi:replicative DNA helicase
MAYFRDADFQERMLALLTRDRKFISRTAGLLTQQDFEARKADGDDAWARQRVAEMAFTYWSEFRQPIGGLLRSEALDYIRADTKLGDKRRQELVSLVERLKNPELLVGVDGIEKKVVSYKRRKRMRDAILEMIELQENSKLTLDSFRQQTMNVLNAEEAAEQGKIVDYRGGLEDRIKRRRAESNRRYPYLWIRPLDQSVRSIPRGQVGLVIAKYKMGKSAFMAHLAQAYAGQGLNTVLFTLEDPKELVEDRLDASICEMLLLELSNQEDLLRRRFKQQMDSLRASIRIVDATGGGWSVERMALCLEQMRQRGWPVDCALIDYDEQIEPSQKFKADSSALRLQSQQTWLELVRWAARDQIFMWCAAQATIPNESKMIITGEDSAEDKSKVRKAGMALGIGMADAELGFANNGRYLYIAAHRFGAARIGWPIVGDYTRGIFYRQEETAKAIRRWDRLLEKRKNSK